jgi:hypothetical protein
MRYNDGAQSDKSQALQGSHLDNADIGHHSELRHVSQGLSYGTNFSAMGMSCKAATPHAKHSNLESMSADARILDSFDKSQEPGTSLDVLIVYAGLLLCTGFGVCSVVTAVLELETCCTIARMNARFETFDHATRRFVLSTCQSCTSSPSRNAADTKRSRCETNVT